MESLLKRRRFSVLAGATAGLVLLGVVMAADPKPAPAAGGADEGRAAYVEHGCYQCHGYDGQGGFAGVRIAPDPLPYSAFAALVRYPANLMPAYPPPLLSDAQLKLIHDYVVSIPQPTPAAEIRALIE